MTPQILDDDGTVDPKAVLNTSWRAAVFLLYKSA
jgi:hypothetical protein